MSGRINYIYIIKGIGIILVIIGHILPGQYELKNYIYSFHMPLFFLTNGIISKDISNFKDCKTKVIKRVYKILIPYFIWALVYANFSAKNILYIIYGSHQTLKLASSLSSLWFLPVMFLASSVFEIVNTFLNSKIKNKKIKNIILIMFIFMNMIPMYFLPKFSKYGYPWGIDAMFSAIIFITIGYLCKKIISSLQDKKSVLFLLLIIGFIGTLSYKLNTTLDTRGYVLMAEALYGNIILFIITSMFGGIMITALAILLSKIKITDKCLSYLGKNTLCVFVTQSPVINLGLLLIGSFVKIIELKYILTLFFTIGICLLINKIIMKSAPNLLGK